MQILKDSKNIVLTGGHARATAYAVIDEIRRRKVNWNIYFIGSKKALEGTNVPTLEAEAFPKLGVEFIPIFTGRLQRKFTIWTIPSLMKIPFGFIHGFQILLKVKPKLIVSFGGYSAFPVVVAGWLIKIPIIVHEQTSAVGRANKYSSFFANKIAISRLTSKKYFPKDKVLLTGNPVSSGVLKITTKKIIGNPPRLLVTGGQTGSVKINSVIEQILLTVLKDYHLVHQAGKFQFQKFVKLRSALPGKLKKRYEVFSVIEPEKWPDFIKHADIIVSRAGANMTSEIIVSGRPSILIPLPIAYLDEQRKNAQYAKNIGIAEIIEQSELNPESIIMTLKHVTNNWNSYITKSDKSKSPDLNASKEFVDLIEKYIR